MQALYRKVNSAVCADVRALARTLHALVSDGPTSSGKAASPSLLAHDSAAAQSSVPHDGPRAVALNASSLAGEQEFRQAGGPTLGRTHPAVRVSDVPEATAPYEAPKWLAGRARKPSAQRRAEWLEGLERWRPEDARTAAELRQAVAHAAHGPGFELARRQSSIEHSDAGMGVWLEGRAGIGAVVGLQPGVCYPEVYHECAPCHPSTTVMQPIADSTDRARRQMDGSQVMCSPAQAHTFPTHARHDCKVPFRTHGTQECAKLRAGR